MESEKDKETINDNITFDEEIQFNETKDATKECETRSECRQRTRTTKGLEMDLEIAKKKRNKLLNDLKRRLSDTYEFLRLPADLVKLTACKDGLESDMDRYRKLNDHVLDLALATGDDGNDKDEDQFKALWDSSLECMADVKTRVKDLEFERLELLSRRSSKKSVRSSRSSASSISKSSANRAAIEAATLKEKMKSLQRRQEIDRQREELARHQRELERLGEQEELQGELDAAEAINGILHKETDGQTSFKDIGNPTKEKDTGSPTKERDKNTEASNHKKTLSPTPSTGNSRTRETAGWGEESATKFSLVTGNLNKQENVNADSSSQSLQTPNRGRPSLATHLDINTPMFVPQPHVSSTQFSSLPYVSPSPYPSQLEMSSQFQSIQKENAEIQKQQIHLLKRLALPAPKPPIFEGDILEYPKWECAFEALVEEDGNPGHKLYYLGQYTGGAAQKTINGLLGLRTEDAYKRAWTILKERYGNPFKIYEAYRRKLADWPPCTTGAEILEISDFLIMTQETMKTVGYLKEMNSLTFMRQLITRLPNYYCNKWRESAKRIESQTGEYTFDNLVEFIQAAASDATHPVFSLESLAATKREIEKDKVKQTNISRRSSARPENRRHQGTTFATSVEHHDAAEKNLSTRASPTCALCSNSHKLEHCKQLLQRNPKERVEICKSKGICFACLERGHIAKNCRRKRECNVCKKPHATLLHYDRSEETQASKATSNCVSVCHVNDCSKTTTSMILPVWLHHKDTPERKVQVYAVLDDQSDTCFVTEEVCAELDLKGPEITLQLGTMHAVEGVKTQRIEGLVVSRHDKEVEIELPRSYSRTQIPSRRAQIPRPEVAKKWAHLEPIAKKMPFYREDLKVGILIGNNCVRAIKPREVIPGKAAEPYALRTVLGWGVIGAESYEDVEDDTYFSSCHLIATKDAGSHDANPVWFMEPKRHKEVINPSALIRMFEQDFCEAKEGDKVYSQQDLQFMKKMKEEIHKTEDGHYEMPLPLRQDNMKLPCNRELAEIRLKQLRRRFDKNSKYKQDYINFMDGMLENGYAEEAPEGGERAWYIPHHGVYHPKKKDKIRVVFNCSAEFHGQSLNRHLLQGPDLTNTLVGVLCRFRKERVAFSCDIEGMFHQVRVNPEHRNYLRFLWWKEGNTDTNPTEYRMKVHLFGATSSPGCANLALRSAADDGEDEFGTQAAMFIRDNFYVDDGLKSVSTVKEAVNLIQNATELCKRGGFRLHKFSSNNKEVLQAIPADERAKEVKELDLKSATLPPERVLGVEWNIENDSFKFRITMNDKPLTRRGILSVVSSIYDPLGFAAPYLLRGKRILQLLCKDNLGWDDQIPGVLRSQWEKWRRELPLLEQLEVPRCFKPENMEEIKKVELHHFSDASTEGYGQCTYLRLVDINDLVHCSLVMGKARVAPLKPVTVPRLELVAAVVSVRVSSMLTWELKYVGIEELFWTDSKVVQGYIYNDARRFHTYVANRVQQIRDRTEPAQWRYVSSENNPADDASRGLTPNDLSKTSRWLRGPAFLWEQRQDWSDFDNEPPLVTDDKELKKSIALATNVKESPHCFVLELVSRFSNWYRAKRALANCVTYARVWISKLKQGKMKPEDAIRKPTVESLREAERCIIKAVQSEAFSDEIKALNNSSSEQKPRSKPVDIKKTSPLYRLDPFLDAHGILRVGGRIWAANLPDDVKHPVILPKKTHATWLVAKAFHEATVHQGRSFTLNEIRASGYWIIGCSSEVYKLISKCATCRKLRAGTMDQRMADLPKDRVTPAPPFSYCAVDYFGPFYVKERRKELKRYGVLFTCLSSRAVHLEVAHTMETDSYINALRRFICRRGPIRQMRSDQGTNLVGATRELKEALNEMEKEKVKAEMLKENCDWFETKMNVPSASHMGGAWERQIRTVRSVLSALLSKNGTTLNDEALRTFMCEAEVVVNSRPLTIDTITSPDSVEALTPNHLLTCKTKVVLPPPGSFQEADKYSKKWWRRVQHLTNEFWCRWKREFLQTLQVRQKWLRRRQNLTEGDIVLIRDDNTARNNWRLARVINAIKGDDGLVRTARLEVGNPNLTSQGKRNQSLTVLERPVHKLVLIHSDQLDERPGVPDEEPSK